MTEKKTIKEKLQGFMPDVGKITRDMNVKFDELIAKLDEMLVELRKKNDGST